MKKKPKKQRGKKPAPLTKAEIGRISKATNFGYADPMATCGEPDGTSPTGKLLQSSQPGDHVGYHDAQDRIAAWLGLESRGQYQELTTNQRKRAFLVKLGKLRPAILLKDIIDKLDNEFGGVDIDAGRFKKCELDELAAILDLLEQLS